MNFRAELRSILPAVRPIVREGGTRTADQTALRGDPTVVRKAINALPNTSDLFPTREAYVAIGYAIKAAVPDQPDEALNLYQEWCARWIDGTNDPAIVEAEWRRMKPPFRRGAQWLYELAARHGGGAFTWGEQWFSPPADEPLFPITTVSEQAERKFTLVSLADAARMAFEQQACPLIEGLIDAGVMSVVYGDSNTGKTFVALDIGYHVASGRPWVGLDTTQGAVVYLAAEGGRGIFKRAAALERKYGPSPDLFIISSPVDLFKADADLIPLIRDILALKSPIVLLVIDTLARAMAGGDENSTKDMSAFVGNCDRLRASLNGAHIMLIHHTGKDASRGARGSSALRAATDTEIEISEGTIVVTKQRDLDKSLGFSFELVVASLGENASGKPVTSCTVTVELDSRPSATRRLSAKENATLEVVRTLQQQRPGSPISAVGVAQAFGYPPNTKGIDRARKQILSLEKVGLVSRSGRGEWTLCDPSRYFDAQAAEAINDKMSTEAAVQRPSSIFA